MSYTTQKQRNIGKMVLTTLVLFVIVVLALVFTGCSVPASSTPDPAASSASTPEEPAAQEPPAIPVFGETITYDDGISVSVSAPAPYTPSELAAGVVEGQQAVVFEIVITNNSTEGFDPTLALASASSAGVEASGIFDTSNQIGFPPSTTVTPGSTIKWQQAFSVADPNNITFELQVGFTHDPALFVSSK